MLLRFAGFELDPQRAELRGSAGEPIKLRPKTFGILSLLAASPGRLVSKQELMDAVWPNIHVGDDSLFQCIRELRTALGDEQRQLVKLVSGRGYLLTPEISVVPPAGAGEPVPEAASAGVVEVVVPVQVAASPRISRLSRRMVLAAAGFGTAAVLVIAAALLVSGNLLPGLFLRGAFLQRSPPTVAVAPFTVADGDTEVRAMAENVAARLTDGLAKIENIRLTLPQTSRTPQADFVVSGELRKTERGWEGRARMSRRASGEVIWTEPISVAVEEPDLALQQSRLAASIGHPLALALNSKLTAEARSAAPSRGLPPGSARVAIEQANATIKQTYCRFLNTTNEFVESLVACGRTLNFDPWDGMALFHIGVAEIQQGRFEDALATFKQANDFDTPAISRWTWRLGAGWVCMLMNRAEEALPWLKSSIAITPASGRSYMLLSAAYEDLGRLDEAKAAMEKGLALRPGSTAINVALPKKNASSTYLTASERLLKVFVAEGLPPG